MFFPTKGKYAIVRSSSIKELAMFGGDISKMVPKLVEDALKEKFNK
jgi:pantetheine-phosphate adenylyltransferase